MKAARISDTQILGILCQAKGSVPVSELYREHGISSASLQACLSSQLISQTRYRYSPLLNDENGQIGNWLERLTANRRTWGFDFFVFAQRAGLWLEPQKGVVMQRPRDPRAGAISAELLCLVRRELDAGMSAHLSRRPPSAPGVIRFALG